MASSCVHLLRLASVHPHYQQQTFRKPGPMLSSPTYVHANLTSSLTRASCSFPSPLLSTGQKHKQQFLSPQTPQQHTSKNTICMATSFYEHNFTTPTENTPKSLLATEICVLVLVYIIPFLDRLNLLSKFPVLKYAMSPLLALLGFYQTIASLDLIVLLALIIGFLRYKRFTKFKYSLQAKVMDWVIVIASLVHPFLVYPDPLAIGALRFQFQLLSVLELLCVQTCTHSCLKFLGTVQWGVPLGVSRAVQQVVAYSNASCPSVDMLAQLMEVVLKTDGDEGRREGKSLVLKLLRANGSLLSDVDSAKTCNKNILSSCQSCLNSLSDLLMKAEKRTSSCYNYNVDKQISLEADNLLWLLDILADKKAAEEFALMWANQQNLANLHKKTKTPSRHLVSCITARLLVGVGNGEIHLAKDTKQLLLQTWFQPLVDDYSCLRKLRSFDPKTVEENIERAILQLSPENQRSMLLAWYEHYLKNNDNCPDLRRAFQDWCRRNFIRIPPQLSLPL